MATNRDGTVNRSSSLRRAIDAARSRGESERKRSLLTQAWRDTVRPPTKKTRFADPPSRQPRIFWANSPLPRPWPFRQQRHHAPSGIKWRARSILDLAFGSFGRAALLDLDISMSRSPRLRRLARALAIALGELGFGAGFNRPTASTSTAWARINWALRRRGRPPTFFPDCRNRGFRGRKMWTMTSPASIKHPVTMRHALDAHARQAGRPDPSEHCPRSSRHGDWSGRRPPPWHLRSRFLRRGRW